MRRLFLYVCLLGMLGTFSGSKYILDDMPCVVDALWTKVNENWIMTTGSYMAAFFSRYDPSSNRKPTASMRVYELAFISGDTNFVNDFRETCHMTQRFARAYFRSLDTYNSWLLMRLTIEDMDLMVDVLDSCVGKIGLGFITSTQFKKGLKEFVFRSLPMSLIFINKTGLNNQILRNQMSKNVFDSIRKEMDYNDDGDVTKSEMGKFWEKGEYDKSYTGRSLFKKLDYEGRGFLNVTHWDEVFQDLNCVSPSTGQIDKKLSHKEFIQLDLILHGSRTFPLDVPCCLDTITKTEY